MAENKAISLRNVTMTYQVRGRPSMTALQDVTFEMEEGEFVAIVGPSGCGKSTMLKLATGLLAPTSGTVRVFGAPVDSKHPPKVGIAFQSPVLMKWRTIYDNVRLPLEVLGLQDGTEKERVHELLEIAGIREFADRYPKELSGGMQQRASICRALVHNPPLLLLDEPFGALDAMTRSQMNIDLARIWARTRKSTLLITHSIDEAVFLADRVIVMSARPGRIQHEVHVDIPRPRDVSVRATPRFAELVSQIGEFIGFQFA